MKRTLFAIALLVPLATAACAATDARDTQDTADAVTADAVVPAGAQTLFSGEASSTDARAQLGVTGWNAYLVNDASAGALGVLLLGTDADDQVAYAVVVAGTAASVAANTIDVQYIRYDQDGVARDQSFNKASFTALSNETARLGALLGGSTRAAGSVSSQSASRLENAGRCIAPVAAGLLVAGALAFGGFVVGSLGFVLVASGESGVTLAVGSVLLGAAPVVGAGVGAGAAAKLGGGRLRDLPRYPAVAFHGWKTACKSVVSAG